MFIAICYCDNVIKTVLSYSLNYVNLVLILESLSSLFPLPGMPFLDVHASSSFSFYLKRYLSKRLSMIT